MTVWRRLRELRCVPITREIWIVPKDIVKRREFEVQHEDWKTQKYFRSSDVFELSMEESDYAMWRFKGVYDFYAMAVKRLQQVDKRSIDIELRDMLFEELKESFSLLDDSRKEEVMDSVVLHDMIRVGVVRDAESRRVDMLMMKKRELRRSLEGYA